ncbi:MAG: mechanosensitive ion channel family protein [Pseudomonadales bacterium]|nr:mechanosensitive ion channel family protein [Pseudomonadales bacterium]
MSKENSAAQADTENAGVITPLAEQLPDIDSLVPEIVRPAWELVAGYPLLAALVIVAVFYLLALALRGILFRVLHGAAGLTNTGADDAIIRILRKPVFNTIFWFGVTLAITLVQLPRGEETLVNLALSIIVMSWLLAALQLTSVLLETFSSDHRFNLIEPRTVPLFDLTGKLLVILIGSYALLMIWGINPVGWLASAGIMGIAVGFAAKDTLGNLFSGFFIVADAPYKLGDYITLDTGERGRVTAIGLRSTRIMTRDDVEVTIPNGVLGNAKIVNESGGPSSSMRIAVPIGVAYGSDVDQVCEVLVEVGRASGETLADPEPRVRMRGFGASSLDFELHCWINQPADRGRIKHELFIAIYKALAAHNITIPFPQQDVYIKQVPADAERL